MSPQFRRWLPALVFLGACRPGGAVQPPTDEHLLTEAKTVIDELDAKIDRLQQLAIRLEGDPERPDYMMKLAKAYSDKKDYFNSLIDSLAESIAEAREAGDETMATRYEMERDEYRKIAMASCVRSYRVLEALINEVDYAGYENLDEALYRFALDASDLGQEAIAQLTYSRMINDFPNSRHVPAAYLAFADYYFDHGHFADAVRLYTKVVGHEDRSLHAYALYKLGCSHVHPLGEDEARYEESLNYFVEAIQATRESGRTRSEKEAKELRRLSRVGLELLAEESSKIKKWDESTKVYKSLQSLFEADSDFCKWQSLIIENERMNGNEPQLRAEEDVYSKGC